MPVHCFKGSFGERLTWSSWSVAIEAIEEMMYVAVQSDGDGDDCSRDCRERRAAVLLRSVDHTERHADLQQGLQQQQQS